MQPYNPFEEQILVTFWRFDFCINQIE